MWNLAIAERDAVSEDRSKGECRYYDVSVNHVATVSELERQGRMEGETSLLIVGSRDAVSSSVYSVLCHLSFVGKDKYDLKVSRSVSVCAVGCVI